MLQWATRVLRKLGGYQDCPVCGQQTIQWVKDPILFEDEPPLFGHWQCSNPGCLVRSEMESTPWADKIAQEHGHATFQEALGGPPKNR